MKRFYLVLGILLLMGGVSYYALRCVDSAKVELQAQIDVISRNLGNPEVRQQEIEQLVDLWHSHSDILRHFIRYGKLDEIQNNIMRLPTLSEHETLDELEVTLNLSYFQIEKLWESEQIGLDTIL